MTIEQRINKLLTVGYSFTDYTIEHWVWPVENKPLSLHKTNHYSDASRNESWIFKIDHAINESCSSECLTSTSEYIRNCKRWMLENNYTTEVSQFLADNNFLQQTIPPTLLEKIFKWTKSLLGFDK